MALSTFNKVTFEITGIIEVGVPTANGHVYTMECAQQLMAQINEHPGKIIVQEMNIPEREKKGIAMYEPMQSKCMAVALAAKLNGDSVDVACETKPTRDGKKLSGMINSVGMSALEFIPVGFGDVVINGNRKEVRNYSLNFIAVELIS